MNHIKPGIFALALLGVAGCQTAPLPQPEEQKLAPRPVPEVQATPSGVKITPYEPEEIKRQKMQIVVPEQKVQQQFKDGRELPAFRKMMLQTQTAYKQGQWSQAESYALQAQRLAPQSAETFLYLSMIANRQNKPANAEALARRGLSYAQSNPMKKQLWLNILKAAQSQKNSKSIQEAKTALNTF